MGERLVLHSNMKLTNSMHEYNLQLKMQVILEVTIQCFTLAEKM